MITVANPRTMAAVEPDRPPWEALIITILLLLAPNAQPHSGYNPPHAAGIGPACLILALLFLHV